MGNPAAEDQPSKDIPYENGPLPPTPPYTEDGMLEQDPVQDLVDIPLPPPGTIPQEVLAIDRNTPDSHIPRDPRLIRLTGVHPLNVEAPLSALFNEGFLTSPELFYVRNHGAVPEVKDDQVPDWEFTVEGFVVLRRFRTPLNI
jgi:nitrate reductase (NAD(P)H)